MAVYNPQDPRDYLKIVKEVEKAKECKYKIEIKKFHPVQTDNQQRYIHFMISYWAMKNGETFYDTLHHIQLHVAPVPFYTGEKDKNGKDKFKDKGKKSSFCNYVPRIKILFFQPDCLYRYRTFYAGFRFFVF